MSTLAPTLPVACWCLSVILWAGAPWPHRRRTARESVTARAIQTGSLVVSRPSAGGRRVGRARHRASSGANARPPVQRAARHGAPALVNVPPAGPSSSPAGVRPRCVRCPSSSPPAAAEDVLAWHTDHLDECEGIR